MPELNNTELELLKTILSLLLLFLTWFIGNKIIHKWDLKKKQKEQNMLSSSSFHQLYGEFNSVWRLWKVHYEDFPTKESLFGKEQHRYWELLNRASAVEGGMEAFFVKLATEKILSPPDLNSLGLFRQAIQQLRQSIRDFEKMDWQRKDKEYILLKELAVKTALLINDNSKTPSAREGGNTIIRNHKNRF